MLFLQEHWAKIIVILLCSAIYLHAYFKTSKPIVYEDYFLHRIPTGPNTFVHAFGMSLRFETKTAYIPFEKIKVHVKLIIDEHLQLPDPLSPPFNLVFSESKFTKNKINLANKRTSEPLIDAPLLIKEATDRSSVILLKSKGEGVYEGDCEIFYSKPNKFPISFLSENTKLRYSYEFEVHGSSADALTLRTNILLMAFTIIQIIYLLYSEIFK